MDPAAGAVEGLFHRVDQYQQSAGHPGGGNLLRFQVYSWRSAAGAAAAGACTQGFGEQAGVFLPHGTGGAEVQAADEYIRQDRGTGFWSRCAGGGYQEGDAAGAYFYQALRDQREPRGDQQPGAAACTGGAEECRQYELRRAGTGVRADDAPAAEVPGGEHLAERGARQHHRPEPAHPHGGRHAEENLLTGHRFADQGRV